MPMSKIMHEFKHGTLHSGGPSGPLVKNRRQAIAIGLSYERREGHKVKMKPGLKKAIHKRLGRKKHG